MRVLRFVIGFVVTLIGVLLILFTTLRTSDFSSQFLPGLGLFILGIFLVYPLLSGAPPKDPDK